MTTSLKIALLLLLSVVLQAAVLSGVDILGGAPDLVLVSVGAVAVYRGAMVGAGAGFGAGLLLDTATLGTLGESSFLLTLVGYWLGRYGETAHRGPRRVPFAVAVATLGYALGALALRFVLGQPAPAYEILIATLLQTMALNVALSWPISALVRRLAPPAPRARSVEGVGSLG
ncbi:MAG: rod shape-determining protein MreD [Thermoleophilia bacterium]